MSSVWPIIDDVSFLEFFFLNLFRRPIFLFASSMYEQPGLRFLEVDGVAPSNDTIRSGEYPLVHDFYCVTNERSSEEALAIRDWLVSRDGQAFVESCGYVSCGSAE